MNLMKNGEECPDNVLGRAILLADKSSNEVSTAIRRMKTVASWHGFEVEGRIWLKDKKTGREYR